MDEIKLTHLSHGMGCGCKMRPQYLEKILSNLPLSIDPNVLVGTGTSDDAGVYKLTNDLAVVQTVDFFTPIVDDPYDFGAIAAANAISDIYAMGATPVFALNIVAFPANDLPGDILEKILKGASDVATKAGVTILGGHSIDDREPKFGMTVTGTVHPQKILSNCNAKPGDVLILTKPVGTGIITTAVRKEIASADAGKEAIHWMKTLNKDAAAILRDFPVNACTDVTGFGLLGHLTEITRGSKVSATISFRNIPFMEHVMEYARAGAIAGGTRGNLEYYSIWCRWDEGLDETMRLMVSDAQTSGGLLISLPETSAGALLKALHAAGVNRACQIGHVSGEGEGWVTVEA